MAKAYIPYKLDKVRNLRYGMVALSLFEETTGKEMLFIDFNKVSIKDLGVLIFVGLYHEDKELTPEKVMELIDDHSSIEEAAELMGKAIDEAFSKNKQAVAMNLGSGTI
jgi:hypothetical protein